MSELARGLLRAADVSLSVNDRRILDHVSVTCEPGRVTALVGASGSGKTTLLNCLSLLQKPTGGAVWVGDAETTHWKPSRRRRFWREQAAFILQDYGVISEESVAYNVTLTSTWLTRRPTGDGARMQGALEATGLADRIGDPARELSGGEKQRLGIARALYKDAAYLFVDEPTASLDAENRQRVLDLLRDRASEGRAVIVATHDETLINGSDVTFALAAGKELT